jgi:hypothetical protein
VQTPEGPYLPIEIDELRSEQHWLGSLEGFPDLYQFTTSEPLTLHWQLTQDGYTVTEDFQVLLVRENDDARGVTEVMRQSAPLEDWERPAFYTLGFQRINMPSLSEEIGPGTYRVEVSAPNNDGDYLLYIGTEAASAPFFVGLFDLWRVHAHFDVSPLRALLSVFVVVPLLLLVSGYVFFIRHKKPSDA